MTVAAEPSPLVILGLEAGDFHLIEQWAQEGHLPTIASLMSRGCWGRLAGPEMVSEHGVWVSLFSGLSRRQHGYYYWRPLKAGTYDLQLADFEALGGLAFWAGLGGRPKKVAIIDPPEGHPLTGLSGVQVANWAPHNPRYTTRTVPDKLLGLLRRRFGPPLHVEERVESNPARDRRIHRGLLKQIEQKGALCRYLIGLDRYDLIVVTFFESHVAGHQFLRYRRPRPAAPAVETELAGAMLDVYRAIDEQLGGLLEALPDNSNAFVLSNVGIHEEYPSRKLLEAFCRELGYHVPARSSKPHLGRWTGSRRALPRRWRAAVGDLLPRRARESWRAALFRAATNWRETTAFPVTSLYTGFVRVNLRGREPEGIVEPGRAYERLLDRLEEDLRQLVDPRSNRPAVKKVTRTAQLFGGGPHASLPDLFIEWTPTPYLVAEVVHPRALLVQENPEFVRGSHHTLHGFVAAAGPRIPRSGFLGDVDVLALAPTFLRLMDEPVPERLTGNAICGDLPLASR